MFAVLGVVGLVFASILFRLDEPYFALAFTYFSFRDLDRYFDG